MPFKTLIVISFLFLLSATHAQDSALPRWSSGYYSLSRLEILSGDLSLHSGVQPLYKKTAVQFARDLMKKDKTLEEKYKKEFTWLFRDGIEWIYNHPSEPGSVSDSLGESPACLTTSWNLLSKKPLLKTFYRSPAHLFEVHSCSGDFFLLVDPVLNLQVGKQNPGNGLFLNQRGIELKGGIDRRLFFYSSILESQAVFPDYINRFTDEYSAIPGAGFYKNYNSIFGDVENGRDFFKAEAYVSYALSKNINVQLGHGSHFVGDGYRSLFLSDFAPAFFYLKFDTRVWAFRYQSIFAELEARSFADDVGDLLIPKKYMVAHYLSFQPLKNLQLGLFESVVFSRENHFEFQYLNPVILYRTVEQAIGSPDNVMIGMNFRWALFNRFSLYGQLLFDEFLFKELLIEKNGWWGNKVGIQAGLKYMNVLDIDHLDARIEFNWVRPYTFSHSDSTANYSHYNQPLAHPLGSNFQEWIIQFRYQPVYKWVIDITGMWIQKGKNGDKRNYGGNILLPNVSRYQDYGNNTLQGDLNKTLLLSIKTDYQLKHNLFLTAQYMYRQQLSEQNEDLENNLFLAGLRLNFGPSFTLF